MFKDTYLIAVYNKEDMCIGVYDELYEIFPYTSLNIYTTLSKLIKVPKCIKTNNYQFYFINTKKQSKDVFNASDKSFSKFLSIEGDYEKMR